ncbi:MAG: hypothetical protein Kow0037_32370 [Calditrichia bacterium]
MKSRYLYLALVLFGAAIRWVDVGHPVDGRIKEAWRETDIAAIARNYYEEGMNLFYPRIDWRGNTPGFAEMEFPLFPYLIALLYKLLGYNEIYGYLISFVFSLLTLLLFIQLARDLLPEEGAFWAALAFSVSPLVVYISNTLQPEGMMLLFYLGSVWSFLRWRKRQSTGWLLLSAAITALAILAKANAAHIGLFFLLYLWLQKGKRFLGEKEIYAFGLLALLPGILWYAHAHQFYLEYGKSLGASNEYHWIGWDFFTNPRFLAGIIGIELSYVWMGTGALVAAIAVGYFRKAEAVRVPLLWLLAIAVYYLLTCRTTSEDWSKYYHVVSAAPAALLLGVFLSFHKSKFHFPRWRIWGIVWPLFGVIVLMLVKVYWHWQAGVKESLLLLTIFSLPWVWQVIREIKKSGNKTRPVMAAAGYWLLAATLLLMGIRTAQYLRPTWNIEKYSCAKAFQPHVPAGSILLVSGGRAFDEDGYPIAANAPYMFFWLHCKGFTLTHEAQSLQQVNDYRDKGARYFIAKKDALAFREGFEAEMRKNFPVLAECSQFILFSLDKKRGWDAGTP